MKIDHVDIKIIDELSKDARLSMRELSKRVNLSSPSVTERVRRLENEGIIEGYTLKVNREKMGLTIQCLIEITLKHAEYDRFKSAIQNCANAVFCYRIAGKACYIIKLTALSMKEIEEFIDSISAFTHTVTYFIFSEIQIDENFSEALNKNLS
ncbi:Lrp/AsnC family transcriptional regulator [Priestia sp. GS2]